MILKNSSFQEFGMHVKEKNKKIILFGAGTLLTSWISYVLQEYELTDRVGLVIDNAPDKQGKTLYINGREFSINPPGKIVKNADMDSVIIITSSYFAEIIKQLDSMEQLRHIECYVAPIMHIAEKRKYRSTPVWFGKSSCTIPKVIHYCWFGKKTIPEMSRRCMESWKKYCPEYEIVEWNEHNYDVYKNKYMGEAYDTGKYGYVPDYARIDILYAQGGIYLDTDVELIRSIDDLLYAEAFTSFEEYPTVNFGGGSGSVKGFPLLKRILDFRENATFLNEDGSYNVTTCGYFESLPLQEAGLKLDGMLQEIDGMTVLPSDYFHPKSSVTGSINITENTHGIHHFNWSWCEDRQLEEKRKTQQEYERIWSRMQRSSSQN